MNKFRISKEEIILLPLVEYKGKINLITTTEQAINACKELAKESVLGFDTETRPSFKKGEGHSVALIQLSGKSETYLFRICFFEMPKELLDIFSNERIVKTGVAIRDDIIGLKKLKKFKDRGFVDISEMAKSKGIVTLGLRSLAGMLLNVKISKGAKLTNWERKKLGQSQLVYAATDSWIGRELYNHLVKSK